LHGGPTGRPGGWPTRLPPSGLLVGGPTGLPGGWPTGLPGGGPCSSLTCGHRCEDAKADSIVPVMANTPVAGTITTADSHTTTFGTLPSIGTAPHRLRRPRPLDVRWDLSRGSRARLVGRQTSAPRSERSRRGPGRVRSGRLRGDRCVPPTVLGRRLRGALMAASQSVGKTHRRTAARSHYDAARERTVTIGGTSEDIVVASRIR